MDLLASEYSWSADYILYNTYPEDFFLMSRQIRMRKIDYYLMELSIVTNPSKEPAEAKKFVENLIAQRRFMRGEEEAQEQLDIQAFTQLRDRLTKESKTIKVK